MPRHGREPSINLVDTRPCKPPHRPDPAARRPSPVSNLRSLELNFACPCHKQRLLSTSRTNFILGCWLRWTTPARLSSPAGPPTKTPHRLVAVVVWMELWIISRHCMNGGSGGEGREGAGRHRTSGASLVLWTGGGAGIWRALRLRGSAHGGEQHTGASRDWALPSLSLS